MDLSLKERLIISNQLRILEKLYPEEAKELASHRKAVEHGYKLHYKWLVQNFYDEMSEKECAEVIEILSMYRAITFSYNNMEDKSELEEVDIKFQGFDGNEETNQFAYAQYFVIDLGRFQELAYNGEYTDFNSHCPMLDEYRRMLEVWNTCEHKNKLTKEQIKRILDT